MLEGMRLNIQERMIQVLLHESPITFHLTGSRFFGPIGPSADWDFFTEYNRVTIQWLRSIGFIEVTSLEYIGASNVDLVLVHERANVHVQCVSNLELHKKARSLLNEWRLLGTFSKAQRKDIWRLAILAAMRIP